MKLNDKLRLAVLCLLATLAVAAYKVQTVPEMVKAANNLLVTLTPEQKRRMGTLTLFVLRDMTDEIEQRRLQAEEDD